jgi:hypothetical protein
MDTKEVRTSLTGEKDPTEFFFSSEKKKEDF